MFCRFVGLRHLLEEYLIMFLRAATLMFVPFLFQPLLFVWFSSVAVSSSPLFILCMLRAFGP